MFSTQLTTLWRCVQVHGEPPLLAPEIRNFSIPHGDVGHGPESDQRSCHELPIYTVWHAVRWQMTTRV